MDRSQWELKRPRGGYPILRAKVEPGVRYLVSFSDLHVGHPNSRLDLLKKAVQWAKDHDALCICGGDWIENSNKTSVGAGWLEQMMTPQQQVAEVVRIMEPIKEQFIGGIIDNHEARSWNTTGFDPMQTICEKMEMPYFGTELYAVISADNSSSGSRSHTVYAVHSGSGHKSSGLALNKIQRDWTFVQADIKIKAHDHQLDYATQKVLSFDPSNLMVRERLQHMVLSGSVVDRPNSYATKSPLAPTRLGFMPLQLNMEKREPEAPRTHWSARPVYELAEG